MKFIGTLVCIYIFISPSIVLPQFSYKASVESGLFINSLQSNFDNTTNIYKLLGSINYSTKYENSESSFSLKIRPEFFGNEFHAIKYAGKGVYNLYTEDINWRSIISYQYFNYVFSNSNSIYSAFSFITGANFKILENTPAQIFFGYSYQNVDFTDQLNSDYYYLDAKLKQTLSGNLNLGYGVFIENFQSKSLIPYSSNKLSKGWYYGPQISLNYLKSFLFTLEYKLLFLTSNNFDFPSYEQRIKSYGGIKLSNYFSFFILIDVYFREIEGKNSNSELLLPTKNENNISAKLNYKLMKNFSVFLKSGYFREEVLSGNRKLDGMNVVIGLEIK